MADTAADHRDTFGTLPEGRGRSYRALANVTGRKPLPANGDPSPHRLCGRATSTGQKSNDCVGRALCDLHMIWFPNGSGDG